MTEEVYTREQWLLDKVEDGRIIVECASSFIHTIAYDTKTHELIVTILYKKTARDYIHKNFGWEEFVAFVSSESKGVHYNTYIKHRS